MAYLQEDQKRATEVEALAIALEEAERVTNELQEVSSPLLTAAQSELPTHHAIVEHLYSTGMVSASIHCAIGLNSLVQPPHNLSIQAPTKTE